MVHISRSIQVCKERSDGIAIVRTFQPASIALAKPQVRNRVTYDPPVNSRMLSHSFRFMGK